MSVGIYGNKRLSSVDFNDVDILYTYSPSREELGDLQFRPMYGSITEADFKKMLGADGGYKMRLPASIFNKLGIYTLLVKPKSFKLEIFDCSYIVTTNETEVQVSKKGIVIPRTQFQGAAGLVGYQVEYFNSNGQKIKNFHRIITSSDPVSVSTNNNNSNASSTSYVLNQNGSYLFLTLSPDELSLVNNQQSVDLGSAGQSILISNTFFDPVMMEVEMVDVTLETLSIELGGNSARDLQTGEYFVFDKSGNLYKQYQLLTRKSEFTQGNLDIRQEVKDVNLNRNFQQITGLTEP
jgi:hypothetical protein